MTPGLPALRCALASMALLAVCLATACATEVNDANQAELEQVQGIGPALSDQILAERQAGLFRDWSDFIARLRGVGPARGSRLSAAGLTVAGQAWAATVAVPAVPAATASSAQASTQEILGTPGGR